MYERKSLSDSLNPTPINNIILFVIFSLALVLFDPKFAALGSITIAAIMLWPKKTQVIIAIATLCSLIPTQPFANFVDPRSLYLQSLAETPLKYLAPFAVVAFMIVARNFLVGRRAFAMVAFMTLYWIGIKSTSLTSPLAQTALASGLIALTRMLWYFYYDLEPTNDQSARHFFRSFAFYRPFWSIFYYAPIPKGHAFWKSITIIDPKQLFKLRLNSLYLLIWGVTLFQIHKFAQSKLVVSSENPLPIFHIPTLSQIISAMEVGYKPSYLNSWGVVALDFALNLLLFTSMSHIIVSVVRFSGLNAPLNTDFPLRAKDPLDFFNRYNRYYKDLLFEAFFFPTFAKLRKVPLAIRTFIATLASVGLGNFLVIFLRNTDLHLNFGLFGSLNRFTHYLIYTLLLSLLLYPWVFASFQQKSSISKPWATWALTAFTIVTFAALRVFDEPILGSLDSKIKFFLHLFGAPL